MTEPEMPQKRPYPMQVEAGKEYHVCMCGKSQNQPLCDGAHAGSGLGPKVFKATEAGFVAFCGCKHSADETGKCDGTHGSLWIFLEGKRRLWFLAQSVNYVEWNFQPQIEWWNMC